MVRLREEKKIKEEESQEVKGQCVCSRNTQNQLLSTSEKDMRELEYMRSINTKHTLSHSSY